MKNGRCFVGLKRNHKAKECRSSLRCSACGRLHHISICSGSSTGSSDPSKASQRSKLSSATSQGASTSHSTKTSQTNQPAVMTMFVGARTPVFLQTANVMVYRPGNPTVSHNTCIILRLGVLTQLWTIHSRSSGILKQLVSRLKSHLYMRSLHRMSCSRMADTVYTFRGKAIIHHCLTTSTCARQDFLV